MFVTIICIFFRLFLFNFELKLLGWYMKLIEVLDNVRLCKMSDVRKCKMRRREV